MYPKTFKNYLSHKNLLIPDYPDQEVFPVESFHGFIHQATPYSIVELINLPD